MKKSEFWFSWKFFLLNVTFEKRCCFTSDYQQECLVTHPWQTTSKQKWYQMYWFCKKPHSFIVRWDLCFYSSLNVNIVLVSRFQKSWMFFADNLKCIRIKYLFFNINLVYHVDWIGSRVSIPLGRSHIKSGYLFCKQSNLLPCIGIVLLWKT